MNFFFYQTNFRKIAGPEWLKQKQLSFICGKSSEHKETRLSTVWVINQSINSIHKWFLVIVLDVIGLKIHKRGKIWIKIFHHIN